jgi:glycerol-3-phosphate dehydrogenase (NAD(P)+)
MKILVLGAGAWGTALAASAAQAGSHHRVTLWARDSAQAAAMQTGRSNARYLPGICFAEGLQVVGGQLDGLAQEAAQQDLLVVASPMAGLRAMLTQLRGLSVPVVWLCKGFEAERDDNFGLLGHEVQAQVAPALLAGVLSGPSFAQEVALGKPTALVAASSHARVREAMVQAFHSRSLRVYANDDVVGVEVGGAVKNVLAIATGLCDGLQLGLNARAALITRGLSEITRLGVALGARAETFMGLSGLGDLVLTATGDLSRNRRVGMALAQGKTLEQAVAELGHVAEGVYCAHTVLQRARCLDVDMPITECVVELLHGRIRPAQAVAMLMGREPGTEVVC